MNIEKYLLANSSPVIWVNQSLGISFIHLVFNFKNYKALQFNGKLIDKVLQFTI